MITNEIAHTQEPMMSSKQIAELIQSNHSDILKSMRRLKAKGLITHLSLNSKPRGIQGGRPPKVLLVNERDSMIVIAQNSPTFTAALVDEWMRLKQQAIQTIGCTTPSLIDTLKEQSQ